MYRERQPGNDQTAKYCRNRLIDMACPRFPTGKLREMIEKTNETGNEHAIVMCGDGSTSKVASGGKKSMSVGNEIDACDLEDGPVNVVHTHPNGVKMLSRQDRQVAASEHVDNVCVAVSNGEVVCESINSCETEVKR